MHLRLFLSLDWLHCIDSALEHVLLTPDAFQKDGSRHHLRVPVKSSATHQKSRWNSVLSFSKDLF
jgi:hypothetical protein